MGLLLSQAAPPVRCLKFPAPGSRGVRRAMAFSPQAWGDQMQRSLWCDWRPAGVPAAILRLGANPLATTAAAGPVGKQRFLK